MDHAPVELRTTAGALLALTQGITRYRVEQSESGRGDVISVWFQTEQLYLVTVDIVALAFKFEVFPLVVKTPAEQFEAMRNNAPLREQALAALRIAVPDMPPLVESAPDGELLDWPFQSWRLDVLKRMEFIIGPEHLPETADALEDHFRSLPAGQSPVGSEHTCITAMGLLFTSDEGARFLVVADGMPGCMRVTKDEDDVQSYLRQCIAVPAIDYVSAL